MSQFLNVVSKEFVISSRRVGLWISAILVTVFYTGSEIAALVQGNAAVISPDQIWSSAALTVFKMNLFFPLVGGILAADRLTRDYRLGVSELQESAPIRRGVNLLGKYIGEIITWLLPEFICVILVGIIPIYAGLVGWEYLGAILVCGLVMLMPTLAFVTAFSMACPMVMPVRAYQVLFTGYWFWGNFLSPQVFPTWSGTLLNAAGIYPLQGFFNGVVGPGITYTAWQGILNIAVLIALIVAVLLVLNFYLSARMKKA
jgi:ABC-2 type transport system permease protein